MSFNGHFSIIFLPPWNLLFIAWTILMPFIILIVVFELFSCLLVFWWILELSTFSGFLHLCVRLRGFFWCLDNLDSFFFMWNCSWYRLVRFITTFLLGKYVTFWHLLTFGATFWYLENFFFIKWMEKVDKNARKHGKVSGPGLYKRNLLVQERPSIQQVRYSTSCSLTCYCLDTWQAWANATKWGQEKLTFADGQSTKVQSRAQRGFQRLIADWKTKRRVHTCTRNCDSTSRPNRDATEEGRKTCHRCLGRQRWVVVCHVLSAGSKSVFYSTLR